METAKRTQLLFNLFGSSWPVHRRVLSRKCIHMHLCTRYCAWCPTAQTCESLEHCGRGIGPEGEQIVLLQRRLAAWVMFRNRGYCIKLRNVRHGTTNLEEIASSAAQGTSISAENTKSLPPRPGFLQCSNPSSSHHWRPQLPHLLPQEKKICLRAARSLGCCLHQEREHLAASRSARISQTEICLGYTSSWD